MFLGCVVMKLMKGLWTLRYAVCKLHTAVDVFASLGTSSTVSLSDRIEASLDILHNRLTSVIYLSGDAMHPILNPRYPEDSHAVDTLIMHCLPHPSSACVGVGDVVAFVSPYPLGDRACWMVRRVAAMEGEVLQSNDPTLSLIVPPGHCWLVADNPKLEPPHVMDSR